MSQLNSHPDTLNAARKVDVAELKRRCPLPDLMRHIGLAKYTVQSCRSPFRSDNNASWGIFNEDGHWHFKDHGNGDSGDELTLLARHLGLDHQKHFKVLLQLYQTIAEVHQSSPSPPSSVAPSESEVKLPDKTGFGPGTDDQLQKLALLRGFSVEAVRWAQGRGVLVFGIWHGFEVYGITDSSGKVLEVRRLDGQVFAAFGSLPERKSHAVKGSDKTWPVGLLEAKEVKTVALVEGLPDFLAAHHLIHKEQSMNNPSCLPVAMLSANTSISDEALSHFNGKSVVIFAHVDTAGLQGASRWKKQLEGAGIKARIFDLSKVFKLIQVTGKDLNDLIKTPAYDQHPGTNQLIRTE